MSSEVIVNARFLTQPLTGSQRFAIELCRGLKQLRPDIKLIAPDNILHKDIAEELDVQIIGRAKKGIIWEQIEMPLYLRRIGSPLFVNLCNMAPVLYANNLVSVLDLSFYLHPEWFSKSFTLLYNSIIPRVAKRARHVITISEYSKQDIHKHFGVPLDKIDIVHPNLSEVFLHPPAQLIENAYGDYVLAVSSIDPRKNFDGLIRAFNACNLTNTKLVIVGSAHKVFADNKLHELVNGNPNIVFTGYVDDNQLINLYRNAKLFAYPSFFEGFGIPPLEAMACGCPTLVSNTTSLPEVCGDASVYVDPNSIDSIKKGIISIIHNRKLRDSLIEKGYNQLKKFDNGKSAINLEKIITKSTIKKSRE